MSTHKLAPGRYAADAHPGLAPFADDPRRACKDVDTSLFFPAESRAGNAIDAKRICAGCIFREPCREWAIEAPEEHGWWGNTSPTWRRAERKRRNRARRPQEGHAA